MKRGYLWLDWVELGCRGWDLEEYGSREVLAFLRLGEATSACLWYNPKVGFRLHVNASPADTVRAINDLVAAGMFAVVDQDLYRWLAP